MDQITIAQPDVCDQLARADGDVELMSADGRKLGTFRPSTPATTPPLTVEELRRRTALPGGKTTAEVLEHLGRL